MLPMIKLILLYIKPYQICHLFINVWLLKKIQFIHSSIINYFIYFYHTLIFLDLTKFINTNKLVNNLFLDTKY